MSNYVLVIGIKDRKQFHHICFSTEEAAKEVAAWLDAHFDAFWIIVHDPILDQDEEF